MKWFSELFVDPYVLPMLVMILEIVIVHVNGISFSETFVIGGLSAIKLVPLYFLKDISMGIPLLAPLAALAFLWYMGTIREIFGVPMATLMTVALVIAILGG